MDLWNIFQESGAEKFMTLLKYLKTIHEEELTDTDSDILDHLEKQLPLIPNLTISELSQKIYTSSTSLHRLVKKLGFDGYTEFKYIIEDYLKNKDKEDGRFSNGNDYLFNTIEDMKITYKLNEGVLEEVIKDLFSHNDIYCFGTGWKQKQIVDNFANDLLYYGHSVKTLRNTDDLEIASRHFDEHSLVVIVSLSGDLKNYKQTVEGMYEPIVGVSIYSDNPLSRLATHSLQFVDSSLDIENHHWSSITLNLIFDQLSHAVSIHNEDE